MKVQIYAPKIAENFQNSFWYHCVLGENPILTAFLKNRTIRIIVVGEIRVELVEGEGFYEGHKAVKEALSFEFTDKDLRELDFDLSNWFQLVYKKGKKMDFLELPDSTVYGEYDEAFQSAKEILEDNELWEDDFWKKFGKEKY